jgi:hypothetical protein
MAAPSIATLPLRLHGAGKRLQSSSHTLNACIFEIMTRLFHGGGVCVPSENGGVWSPFSRF